MTIGASLPTATVTIAPLNPIVGQTITATAAGSDTDNNPVSLTYEWFRNGLLVPSDTTNTYVLSPSQAPSGDLITVTVTPIATLPNNTTQTGTAVSASTYVASSLPSVTVSLTPPSPTASQAIVATAVPFDANGSGVTLQYQWFLNNSTTPVQNDTKSPTTPNYTTDTLTVTPPRGTIVTVTVTPTAGGLIGAVGSSSVTVVNAPPVVSVAIAPQSPLIPTPNVPDVLTATVSTISAGNALTYTYFWSQTVASTHVTSIVKTTIGTSSNTDTLDLSQLPAGSVNMNDAITVQVIPNDGTTDGQAAQTSILVNSTLPTVTLARPDTEQPDGHRHADRERHAVRSQQPAGQPDLRLVRWHQPDPERHEVTRAPRTTRPTR